MRPFLTALAAALLASPAAAQRPMPAYRGFLPGAAYADFAARANARALRDSLVCTTSRRTAQLMECGLVVRDSGGGTPYLSAYVLEGRVAMVAWYDSTGFGSGDGPALVAAWQRAARAAFGTPHPRGRGAWEWKFAGARAARLTWRARGTARWVSLTLTDDTVMARIRRYLPAADSARRRRR